MSSRRTFLLATWDGGGVIPPTLSVARRLIAAGHRVVVLSDPTVEPEARAAGCDFMPWVNAPHRLTRDRDDDLLRDYAFTDRRKYFADAGKVFLFEPGPRWFGDVLDAIDAHRPDAVVCDFMVPWAAAAAQARGLPAAVLSTHAYMLPTPGAPPLGAAALRVPRWLEPARDAFIRWMMERMFDAGLPTLNGLRVAHGLPPLAHLFDQVRVADRLLVLTAAAFDPPPAGAPVGARWVGAPLDDPAWCEPWRSPWAADDPRPLVLVGLSSTFQDQVEALRRLVAALATLPVRAVVTTGPAVRGGEIEGAGDVHVVASAPHAAILPEAAVVVTHCGHGTTLKALTAGVPMLCLPMGRDQDGNAARVAALGAGLVVPRDASVEALAGAVRRLLDEPGFGEAARAVGARIRAGEGEVDVVEALEELFPAALAAAG